MVQKDPENGPSLELPSLFGRRKRRSEQDGDTKTDEQRPDATAVIPVVREPVVREPVVQEPDVREPTVDKPAAHEPAVGEPATAEPVADLTGPATAHTPAATPTPVPEPTTVPEPAPEPVPRRRASSTTAPAGQSPRSPGGHRRAESSGRSVPDVGTGTAVLGVGALVGLLGCVLTFLGLKGCEAVTGTDSCGGPGLLVLVVILVVMVLAGAAALRALRVTEPGNLSFLGVGITTVVVLLFLIDQLYEPWMFAVIPVLTALGFAVARWITTRYTDEILDDDDGTPHVDVR